jgi:hypothetical protein
MRIIGQIEHPQLKITVFKMDNRISVKFENSLYEQTFKLGEDERLASKESVEQLIDAQFMEQVQTNFRTMHQIRLAGYARAFPQQHEAGFETII